MMKGREATRERLGKMLIKGEFVHGMLHHPVHCRSSQSSSTVQNVIHHVPVLIVIVRTGPVFNVVLCVGGILNVGIINCGDGGRCRLH